MYIRFHYDDVRLKAQLCTSAQKETINLLSYIHIKSEYDSNTCIYVCVYVCVCDLVVERKKCIDKVMKGIQSDVHQIDLQCSTN